MCNSLSVDTHRLTCGSFPAQSSSASSSSHQETVGRRTQLPESHRRAGPAGKVWATKISAESRQASTVGRTRRKLSWSSLMWISSSFQPVCGLFGVGKTKDGVELHAEDEMEDEEGLLAHGTGHIVLLKQEWSFTIWLTAIRIYEHLSGFLSIFFPLALIILRLPSDRSWAAPLTVRPSGKSKRSCCSAGAAGELLGGLWTELKSLGWWRLSCCSFSGFWVSVAENSSFWRGIWGGDRLTGEAGTTRLSLPLFMS